MHMENGCAVKQDDTEGNLAVLEAVVVFTVTSHVFSNFSSISVVYFSSEDGVWLPMWLCNRLVQNGHICNILNLQSAFVIVQLYKCIDIPGDPQSVQLWNATSTTADFVF